MHFLEELQEEDELKKILIDLISFRVGGFQEYMLDNLPSLFLFVYEELKHDGYRGYAARVRDDIYEKTNGRPRRRDSSNNQLSQDTHEFRQEVDNPEGYLFSTLSFLSKPDGNFREQDILRDFNRVEKFGISDLSTDLGMKLTVAAGIACARRSRLIGPTQSDTFVEVCWLICDRFERFSCDESLPHTTPPLPILPPTRHAPPITPPPPATTAMNHQDLPPPFSVLLSQPRYTRSMLEQQYDQVASHALAQSHGHHSSSQLVEFQGVTRKFMTELAALCGQYDLTVRQFLSHPPAPPCTPEVLSMSEASESYQKLIPDFRGGNQVRLSYQIKIVHVLRHVVVYRLQSNYLMIMAMVKTLAASLKMMPTTSNSQTTTGTCQNRGNKPRAIITSCLDFLHP